MSRFPYLWKNPRLLAKPDDGLGSWLWECYNLHLGGHAATRSGRCPFRKRPSGSGSKGRYRESLGQRRPPLGLAGECHQEVPSGKSGSVGERDAALPSSLCSVERREEPASTQLDRWQARRPCQRSRAWQSGQRLAAERVQISTCVPCARLPAATLSRTRPSNLHAPPAGHTLTSKSGKR